MEKVDIKNKLFLAPMAGFSDQAFRLIAFQSGVDIVYSEMVSAKAIKYKDKKTFDLLNIAEGEKCVGIQLFGSDKEILGNATKMLDENNKVSIVDFNMGCPAPKIFKNGEGSALLDRPNLIYEILYEMRKNTSKSLSAKMRIGIEEKNNYLEVAKAIEEAGVDFIIVHGRTRKEYYSGLADWEAIGNIKANISIPVVGNGDINFNTNIKKLLKDYKVDGLMVGRGAVGSPWIFEKLKADINGTLYQEPSLEDKFNIIINHIELACKFKGERIAVPELRKHLHGYLKGMRDSAKLKNLINSIKNKEDLVRILLTYKEEMLTYLE